MQASFSLDLRTDYRYPFCITNDTDSGYCGTNLCGKDGSWDEKSGVRVRV
jgi:hypothetical protein